MRTLFLLPVVALCALALSGGTYSVGPAASPLPGTGFRGDAGFEVADWSGDGKPDLFVYDTGSDGGGSVYLNLGTLSHPRFGHDNLLPFNSTETTPQTMQHISARAYCDLNHDGLTDVIFFDGQLRYCPNLGTKSNPYWWSLWPRPPGYFPGTAGMIRDNTRYSTGPESIYWNKGIFARQVLTLTVADWDGDGLEDLLICRTHGEAPGVVSLGEHEEWTNWGRIATGVPANLSGSDRDTAGALKEAPERGLWFYKNIGTPDRPMFDKGLEIVTPDGRPIAAPNPVVTDVDGDGVADVVSTETEYTSNAFRVDWPAGQQVVWFRRSSSADPAHLELARPLSEASGLPIKSGTLARFADLRGQGVLDLLVSEPGYPGTIRWYRNAAGSPREKLELEAPVILAGSDFGRFEFMDQPLIVDWFGPGSRDLLIHGVADAHCKWGLRRTALYKSVADRGEIRYQFAGLLNFSGDPAMVPLSAEERPYDVYGSAISFARDSRGKRHLMMSVAGNLFYFSDLAPDGLTFRRMQRVSLGAVNNRQRGWQEVGLTAAAGEVKFIRISNDIRGRAHLSDGMLDILRFEAIADGKNVATVANGVQAERFDLHDGKTHGLDRAMNLFTAGNANTDSSFNATSFGKNDELLVTLGQPSKLERIRFLLSDRDAGWYSRLVPFSWQGRIYRAGYEQGEVWYQYKVEVSADGSNWTTVSDRLKTEMLYSHPVLIDRDGDGRLDMLLYFTSADAIYPSTKTLRFYRNLGTDENPRYAAPIDATDEYGKVLEFPANWARYFSPQCGIAVAHLDGSGAADIILEGGDDGQLLRFRDVSSHPKAMLTLASEGSIMMGQKAFETHAGYWYFDVADADGDGTPDLIESNNARPMFYKGARAGAVMTREVSNASGLPDGIILRNGSSIPGGPVYAGNEAVSIDARKLIAATNSEPEELEFRGQQGGRENQKMILLRFNDLPDGPVDKAVLELSTDAELQADPWIRVPGASSPVSCNAIGNAWDPLSCTYRNAAERRPWPANLLDKGGTFQSFVEPVVDQRHVQRLRWDVTQAVRAAHDQGRNQVDLLIRVDGTGPDVAGRGLRVCGPGWPVIDQRPKLILTTTAAPATR